MLQLWHVFYLSCLCEVHFILLICEAFLTTSEWYLPFFLTTLLLIYKTMHTCTYGDILARGWPPLCWCDSWFAGLMHWEEVISEQWWFCYKHCLQAPELPAHHLFVFFLTSPHHIQHSWQEDVFSNLLLPVTDVKTLWGWVDIRWVRGNP